MRKEINFILIVTAILLGIPLEIYERKLCGYVSESIKEISLDEQVYQDPHEILMLCYDYFELKEANDNKKN